MNYINNGIKYGRNKWAFKISIIKTSDSNEIIRAGILSFFCILSTFRLMNRVLLFLIFHLVCDQMSRGVLAIFGYTSASAAEAIKSYADFYQVPYISLTSAVYKKSLANDDSEDSDFHSIMTENSYESSNNTSLNENDQITIKSNDEIDDELDDEITTQSINKNVHLKNFQINMHPDIIPLLVSLIKYNRWKTIFYLYNNDEGLLYFLILSLGKAR